MFLQSLAWRCCSTASTACGSMDTVSTVFFQCLPPSRTFRPEDFMRLQAPRTAPLGAVVQIRSEIHRSGIADSTIHSGLPERDPSDFKQFRFGEIRVRFQFTCALGSARCFNFMCAGCPDVRFDSKCLTWDSRGRTSEKRDTQSCTISVAVVQCGG